MIHARMVHRLILYSIRKAISLLLLLLPVSSHETAVRANGVLPAAVASMVPYQSEAYHA